MGCTDHDPGFLLLFQEALGTNLTYRECNTDSALQVDLRDHDDLFPSFNNSMLFIENTTGKNVYAYATPIIIVIGLIGNLLSLCVFTSKQLRKLSASLYLVALSASDTIVLVTYVLMDWLLKGLPQWPGGSEVGLINIQGICQMFLFISYTFRFISVYLIVVFTIERYIAVCKPLHRRRICTKRFAHRIIIGVHILGAIISIYKPVISGVITHNINIDSKFVNINSSNNTMADIHDNGYAVTQHEDFDTTSMFEGTKTKFICTKLDEFAYVNTVLELIYGLSITIVPFVFICILNILIMATLQRGSIANNNRSAVMQTRSRVKAELTVTLIGVSSTFILLNLPYLIVWFKLHLQNDPFSITHPETRQYLYITKTIFIVNYSINFFIYSMTGSYYRGVIKKLLGCHQGKGRYTSAMQSDVSMKTELKDMTRLTPSPDNPSVMNRNGHKNSIESLNG